SSADAETWTDSRRPAPSLPDWLPGYEIQGEIHRGGQGVVYRAVQKAARRTVAIKVMREGPFAGARDQARFEREVQILGQLRHPNIVTVHDGGVAAGHSYIVMDLIEGKPLDRHVEELGSRAPRIGLGNARQGTLDPRSQTPASKTPATFIREKLRLFETICEA